MRRAWDYFLGGSNAAERAEVDADANWNDGKIYRASGDDEESSVVADRISSSPAAEASKQHVGQTDETSDLLAVPIAVADKAAFDERNSSSHCSDLGVVGDNSAGKSRDHVEGSHSKSDPRPAGEKRGAIVPAARCCDTDVDGADGEGERSDTEINDHNDDGAGSLPHCDEANARRDDGDETTWEEALALTDGVERERNQRTTRSEKGKKAADDLTADAFDDDAASNDGSAHDGVCTSGSPSAAGESRVSLDGDGASTEGSVAADRTTPDITLGADEADAELFPDAPAFMIDNNNVQERQSPVSDNDDDGIENECAIHLVEAFREDETGDDTKRERKLTGKSITKTDREKNQCSDGKKTKVARDPHPNQSLFDILDRNFDGIEPHRVSEKEKILTNSGFTSKDVKLCFVAFVETFTPPPETPFSKEYSDVFDGGSARGSSCEDVTSSNATIVGATPTKEVAEKSTGATPRPRVPLGVVHAVWKEVLQLRTTELNADAEEKEKAVFAGRSDSFSFSAVCFVQDSLVALGFLDIKTFRRNDSKFDRSEADGESCNFGNKFVDGDEALGTRNVGPDDALSVSDEIHQQYGEYLASGDFSDAYSSIIAENRQRWSSAAAEACLRERDAGDRTGYSFQMLPWNMMRAGNFEDAADLLMDKTFVRKRIKTLGVADGTTAHVTDVDELLFSLQDEEDDEVDNVVEKKVAALAYEQVKVYLARLERQLNVEVNSDAGEELRRSSDENQMRASRDFAKFGEACHIMAASLGSLGLRSEEMTYYREALRLKRLALGGGESASSVSISDTLHCIGFANDGAGNYKEALDSYNQALIIRRSLLGDNDLRVAETCHNKGAILCENGHCEEAMDCLEEALRIREAHYGEEHESCADTLQWMGNVMREWGDPDEALHYFKNALRIKMKALGIDHIEVANTLVNTAILLDDMAKYELSMQAYTDALRIKKEVRGDCCLEVADILLCMGNVSTVKEEHTNALNYFEQSIDIRERLLKKEGEDHGSWERDTLLFLTEASTCRDELLVEYRGLIECLEEALPLKKLIKGANHESVGDMLNRMGDVYVSLRDWDNAIGSFQGALRVRKAGTSSLGEVDNDLDVANLLQKRGRIHLIRGEYGRATSSFENASHIKRRIYGKEDLHTVSTEYCLGVAHFYSKEAARAVLRFEDILVVRKKQLGRCHADVGHTLYWLGRSHELQAKHDKSLACYLSALRVYKENRAAIEQRMIVSLLHDIAHTYDQLDQWDMSLKCYNEEIRLIRAKLEASATDTMTFLANALSDAGDVYRKNQDAQMSIEYFSEAVDLFKRTVGEENVRVASTLEKIGLVAKQSHEYEMSKRNLIEAYRLYEKNLGRINLRTASVSFELGEVLETLDSACSPPLSDSGLDCFKECLRVQRKKLGSDHKDIATTLFTMGKAFTRRNAPRDAISCFEEALTIRRKQFGDVFVVATTLRELAKAYHASCELPKALVFFKDSIRIAKKNGDVMHVAMASYEMALCCEESGNNDMAARCFSDSLKIWKSRRSIDGSGDKYVPLINVRLGAIYEKLGQYHEAITCFQDALEAHKEENECDQKHDVIASLFASMGKTLALTGDYSAALEYYKRHIETATSKLSNRALAADSLFAMANICARTRDYDESIKLFRDCLAIRRSEFGSQDESVAKVLYNMAIVYEKALHDDNTLAVDCLKEALRTYKIKRKDAETALTLQVLGRIYGKRQETEAAIECFEEALRLRKAGQDDLDVASTMHHFASLLGQMRETDKAMEMYEKAYSIRKSKLGLDNISTSDTLYKLAECLCKRHEYKKALGYLRKVLPVRRSIHGESHIDVANCHHSLGLVYSEVGDFDKAFECFSNALRIKTGLAGADSLTAAATLHALGRAYGKALKYDEGIEALVKALRIRKMELGNDALECAQTIRSIGDIKESSGEKEEALNCYQEALRVFKLRCGEEHATVCKTLESIAHCLFGLQQYEMSLSTLQKCLAICEKLFSGDHPDVATLEVSIGNSLQKLGRPDDAILHYKKAVLIRGKKFGSDDETVADVVLEIGGAMASEGRYHDATECYGEVIRILTLKHGKDHIRVADVLNKIGDVHCHEEDFDSAIQAHRDAIDIYKRHKGNDAVEVGHTMQKLGGVYDAMENYDESFPCFMEAHRIFKLKLGDDALDVSLALNNLGINHARRKEYSTAVDLCSEALRIRRRHSGNRDIADSLFNIGMVLEEWGKAEEALTFYTESLGLYRTSLNDDDVAVAHCLRHVGEIHGKADDSESAIDALSAALRIYLLNIGGGNCLTDVASTQESLGMIYSRRFDYDKALPLFVSCLKVKQNELSDYDGLEVAATLERIGNVCLCTDKCNEALEFFTRSLHIYEEKLGTSHARYAGGLLNVARALCITEKDFDLALAHCRTCLEIYKNQEDEENEDMATVFHIIGMIQNKRVDYDEAMKGFSTALRIRSSIHGKDHEQVAETMYEMGQVFEEWGDNDEAMEVYGEVLRILRLQLGENHKRVADVLNKIGGVHFERGDFDSALRAFRDALDTYKRLKGDDAVEVGHTLLRLGGVCDAMENYDESFPCFMEAHRIFKLKLGDDDLNVSLALNNLGIIYARQKQYSRAIELCMEALRIRRLRSGNDQIDIVADSLFNIGNILDEWGKDDQSFKFYTEALDLYRSKFGDDDVEVASCLEHIGTIQKRQKDFDEALACFGEALRIRRLKDGDESLTIASTLFEIGQLYAKKIDYDRSLACFAECLRIRENKLDSDDSDVIAARRFVEAVERKVHL